LDRLIKEGSVNRAYLGVGIAELTPDSAELLELPAGTQGVFVTFVQKGKPADKAGIQVQDVIVAFDDHEVHTPRDLQEIVEQLPVDSEHRLTILRNGRRQNLTVRLDDLGQRRSAQQQDAEEPDGKFVEDELGLEVEELTADAAESLGLAGESGALVTNVARTGLAAQAGVRPGMLITRIGSNEVKDVASLKQALKEVDFGRGVFMHALVPEAGGRQEGTQVFLLKRR
jgi:serine protease Do